jgi:uncharacterized phosphosugar-binding protein
MTPAAQYLERSRRLITRVEDQLPEIRTAGRWFAETILRGRMVHLFGSGHSRILVEEMWPRYGSFPGFNPIVELSLSFHNLVVGANGQRQAMFLENVPGLAARILRNFDISPDDCALVASSSGCNVVPIEMAEEFRRRRVRVVAIISRDHSEKSRSARADGRRLQDFADLVLDTGAPAGDAMVKVEGLATPVSPGSTVGGCLLINAIKAEVADRLTRAGQPPTVLTAAALVGRDRATDLFESAYDEHGRRMAKLYAHHGESRRVDSRASIDDSPREREGLPRSRQSMPREGSQSQEPRSREPDGPSWSPGEAGQRGPYPSQMENRRRDGDRHGRRGDARHGRGDAGRSSGGPRGGRGRAG